MSITVAKVLDNLSQMVESFISREMVPPLLDKNSNILAARAVSMAIDNAAVAYDYPGILKLMEDKVEATVRAQLAELRKMVDVLQSKQGGELLSLHSRVQQFIFSLSLADWQPKLTRIQPEYAYIEVEKELMLRFEGLFRCAASLRPQRPELSLANSRITFYPQGSKDESLKFSLPTKELAFSESAHTNCYLVKGMLSVFYSPAAGRASLKALYHVHLLTFPLSLGEIKLTYSEMVVACVVQQHFRSATFKLDRKDFGHGQLIEREIIVKPSHGWQISSTPQIHSKGAVEEVLKEQFNEMQASVKLSLPADQEEVVSHVEFDERQNEMREQPHEEMVKLQWGMTFSFEASSYHIDFVSFKGHKYELKGPDANESNPYLKILRTPKGYQLVAAPPTE